MDRHDDRSHELQWRGQGTLLKPKQAHPDLLRGLLLPGEHGDHQLLHWGGPIQLQEDQGEGDRGERHDGVLEALAEDKSADSAVGAPPKVSSPRKLD